MPFQPLLPNTVEPNSNFIAVQRVFSLPFSLSIVVDTVQNKPESFWSSMTHSLFGKATTAGIQPSDEEVDSLITIRSQLFQARFDQIFPMPAFSPEWQRIARAGLSNLVAGISYFYGDTIQRSPDGSEHHTAPGFLLTGIPGRSYFPRGFIWDEGFHQLLVARWDPALSVAILSSWLNRMEDSVGVACEGEL